MKKQFILGPIAIILFIVGFTFGFMDRNHSKVANAMTPERLTKLRKFHKEGRICDKCAKDNFIAYQPCWKATPIQLAFGMKACNICTNWGKCCRTKQEDCCCWDQKEDCYKKCKIPKIPHKGTAQSSDQENQVF